MLVDGAEGAFEARDAEVELVDVAVVAGNEGLVGLCGFVDDLEFAEFGGDGDGLVAELDEGEVPVVGDADFETQDLPAGNGDVADEVFSDLVFGLEDFG